MSPRDKILLIIMSCTVCAGGGYLVRLWLDRAKRFSDRGDNLNTMTSSILAAVVFVACLNVAMEMVRRLVQ